MAGNETLSARNRAALDEWYTQLTDIKAELRHYRDQFKGKVVLCNCDDPCESLVTQDYWISVPGRLFWSIMHRTYFPPATSSSPRRG